jgi:hypothetical protein
MCKVSDSDSIFQRPTFARKRQMPALMASRLRRLGLAGARAHTLPSIVINTGQRPVCSDIDDRPRDFVCHWQVVRDYGLNLGHGDVTSKGYAAPPGPWHVPPKSWFAPNEQVPWEWMWKWLSRAPGRRPANPVHAGIGRRLRLDRQRRQSRFNGGVKSVFITALSQNATGECWA